ncbi:MAG: hypothetical protein M5U08_23990 [Burkholderiales bacterium]|nr:hypothetical protein [Burkholderiales bacterium]
MVRAQSTALAAAGKNALGGPIAQRGESFAAAQRMNLPVARRG